MSAARREQLQGPVARRPARALALSPAAAYRTARRIAASLLPPVILAGLMLLLWDGWVRLRDVPVWLVPPPGLVLERLLDRWQFFLEHGYVTLGEALLGLLIGTFGALLLAVTMAHSRFLERGLYPLAIMLKVTPVVVWAPLFVLWFGFGTMPKVFIAALIAFFPMLVNMVTGLRAVPPDAHAVFRSIHASTAEVLWRLRVPFALPYLFAALRVSALLCVIGAVVAEWSGADRGIGHVIAVANSNLDTATVFAGIITLTFMGAILNAAVLLLERRILAWHDAYLP